MLVKLKFLVVLVGLTLFFIKTCYSQDNITSSASQKEVNNSTTILGKPVLKKNIEEYQLKLLNIAFESATAIPVEPHIKDRSRIQEKVVKATLELDQPITALNYIGKIDNWRRGVGYAELAFYSVTNNSRANVEEYLDLAKKISNNVEDWRKDRVKVKIAGTYAMLGESNQVDKLEGNVVDSESGKVAGVKAMIASNENFNEQINTLDGLIATGNFDIIKNTLRSYSRLFNRFYEDKEKLSIIENRIITSWDKMPIFVRFDLVVDLAMFSIEHNDKVKSIELVNEAQHFIDGYQWPLDYQIKFGVKLAKLNFLIGDKKKARNHLDSFLDLFDLQGNKIVNIYRAEVLRPLAETYQTMGDTNKALSVYKIAVEEGFVNPNSRPRAEDLSATCLSMALNKVEPDKELWTRISEINNGLEKPW